ncbi:ribosomal protein S18-alanine N-acetyltransferase [Bacillus sp. HMF5848]|uniref:ribosomal protein S18-alanine N-acetyltransferase n=1 Tax=Bacillus sp. HMF5848 TaxID=2495421 RepID=UPI0021AE11DA|nr:ribosomal protein S18-alanine N-acetyltransferase [Bacillus sp. HMF5848]
MNFRMMKWEDLDEVMEIERASFTLPWKREAYENELLHNQYARYIVLEHEGHIAGYCGMWLVIDEAHITNVAISPSYRGKKLGDAIMRYALQFAYQHGAATATLEVRISNMVARNLYKKLGFLEGGIRKHYYQDNGEDAIVMWVKLR